MKTEKPEKNSLWGEKTKQFHAIKKSIPEGTVPSQAMSHDSNKMLSDKTGVIHAVRHTSTAVKI